LLYIYSIILLVTMATNALDLTQFTNQSNCHFMCTLDWKGWGVWTEQTSLWKKRSDRDRFA